MLNKRKLSQSWSRNIAGTTRAALHFFKFPLHVSVPLQECTTVICGNLSHEIMTEDSTPTYDLKWPSSNSAITTNNKKYCWVFLGWLHKTVAYLLDVHVFEHH